MKKTTLLALLVTALAGPAVAQQTGLWPPSLVLDTAPPSTATIPIWEVGDTRAKRTTVGYLRANLFDLTTVGAGNLVWATPNGSSGIFSARSLVVADIPSLSTLYAPAWSGQLQNLFWASPSGAGGAPVFRAITAADVANSLLPPAKIGFSTTSRLLGSNGSGAGGVEISLGSGLSLSGNVLNASAGGSVTSIGVTVPSFLNVSPATITTSGTFAFSFATGMTPGRVIGTCSGATVFGICQLSLSTDVTGTLQAAQFPALTGAVTTSAGSTSTALASSLTITTPTINKPTIGIAGTGGSSHIKTAGTSPTASCTGLGTGSTAAVLGSDGAMVVTMTAGTGAASSGTCAVTFNSTFTNNAICVAQLSMGSGTWQSTSTVILSTASATAPQFTWVNNNNSGLTPLTSGQTYGINVICMER